MKKKLSELSKKERNEICLKHFNKNFFNTCENCPLLIEIIHCYNGSIEDLQKAKNKVAIITKRLKTYGDKEIEVEDNE